MSDPVDIRYMARIWRIFGRPDLEGRQANDNTLIVDPPQGWKYGFLKEGK